MRAALQKRVGAHLVVSVLSIALFATCRSRPGGIAPVAKAPIGAEEPAPVAPSTGVSRNPGEVALHIRGRVLDELGQPPAATIYVLRWQGDPAEEGPVTDAVSIVTTDARGEFAFDWMRPQCDAIRIDVEGLAPRRLWLPVDGTRSPILLLGTRTLQGTVRDPEGRAVAGALVRVFVFPDKTLHDYEGTGHGISVRTRSDGSYRVDRLPGGRCRITVEGKTSEGQEWFEEEHWSFAGSEPAARVDLGLPAPLPRVTVRVRAAPGGNPETGHLIGFRAASGRRRWAKPNADGTYAIRLPPGSYGAVMSVSVEHDGVSREGEAALLGADGRPATLTIRPAALDPSLDLYLPAK